MTFASNPAPIPLLLELEITGFCQLSCAHCYADSGPDGGSGTMTADDWERVIDQAAALGVRMVQFIGGEPTLAPALPRLMRRALAVGLTVQVYSNLVHVTSELWELFGRPGVSLGTSWYAADQETHGQITKSRSSYARTRANIALAVKRGIPVCATVVGVLPGQDTAAAARVLSEAGVTDIRVRPQRRLGRAASHDAPQDPGQLCGHCGDARAAVLPDGTVTPCVIGRWLQAGNVRHSALAGILAGPEWQARLAAVPRRTPGSGSPMSGACPPESDGNDCPPASNPTCAPSYCAPDTGDDLALTRLATEGTG